MPVITELSASVEPSAFDHVAPIELRLKLANATNRCARAERQVAFRDTALHELREAITLLNAMMNQAADEQNLCDAYDQFVVEVNDRIDAFQLTPRAQEHTLKFEIEIIAQGVGRDETQEAVRDVLYHRLDGHDIWDSAPINLTDVTVNDVEAC